MVCSLGIPSCLRPRCKGQLSRVLCGAYGGARCERYYFGDFFGTNFSHSDASSEYEQSGMEGAFIRRHGFTDAAHLPDSQRPATIFTVFSSQNTHARSDNLFSSSQTTTLVFGFSSAPSCTSSIHSNVVELYTVYLPLSYAPFCPVSFLRLASPRAAPSLAIVAAPSPRLCRTPVLASALVAWPAIVLGIDVLCTSTSPSCRDVVIRILTFLLLHLVH